MRPWISALFFCSALSAHAQPVQKTIELEWEEVPNASAYVIKLTPIDNGSAGQPLYYTTPEAKLSEQVPVGLYQLRIRSRSKEDESFSKWSDPIPLEVLVKEMKPISPADNAVIEAKNKLSDNVTLSWTPIEKVKEYTITIWTNDAADKPFTFKTQSTSKVLAVKTGRDYHWQVNFETSNDISYAQTPPVFHFTMIGPKLIKPSDIKIGKVNDEHVLEWTAHADAKEFKNRLLFRFLDEKDFKPMKEAATSTGSWNVGKLPPGAYRFEVNARAPQRVDSDKSDFEFSVKPTESELFRR
ncbi:MAG: hypothetical protein KF799_05610 [Bdellovibrionales bacterium]|nr:hypothetical protein [Bdellovibrionales bacterium]